MDFYVTFREDSPCMVVGRVTAPDATGAYTGIPKEGYWVKVADLTSIDREVFDITDPDAPVSIITASLTVADAIEDVPITTRQLWKGNAVGWNFSNTIPNTAFPVGNHRYSVEYRFTPTSGSLQAWTDRFIGLAEPRDAG